MHNLRRVAAGLRGEYLEPEATPEPEDQEAQSSPATSKKNKKGKKNAATNADVEWQNMSEFERDEGRIEVGEIGSRTNVVEEGGEIPEVEVVGDAEMDDGDKKKRKNDTTSKSDKEARKKAKKARNKEFKAKKEKARLERSE